MRFIIILAIVALQHFAHAEDSLSKCSSHFELYEKQFDLPKHLLSSVSMTETGRWDYNKKSLYSWPWSVNHSGKAYFFESKNEAILFVSNLIQQGHRNIDVGCMQVNLNYHPSAFENLYQAFDPKHNIAYAASLIKKHYLNSASWVSAIARYHSGEKSRGIQYANKVLKIWQKHSTSPSNDSTQTKFSRKIFRTPSRNPIRYKNDNSSYRKVIGQT